MSDEEEFAQIAMAAIEASKAEATPAAEPPKETASETASETKPEAEKQPEAGTGDGKPAEPVEAKTEEAPKLEPPKEEPKKTDWKAAAAAERAKQATRNQTRQQLAQLEQVKAKLARYEAIEAKKESDPLAAAEEFGLSYDRMTKAYIKTLEKDPNQPTPEAKTANDNFHRLEAEVKNLKAQLAIENRQKVLTAFESEIETTLKTKADDFELTKTAEEDGRNLVKSIVGAHWRKTATFDSQGNLLKHGEDMPTEEACRLAEEYFERKQLKRWAETKKFKALASPKPPPKPEDKKPATATLSQSLRQGGGDTPTSYADETTELLAMVKRLEAQQGN